MLKELRSKFLMGKMDPLGRLEHRIYFAGSAVQACLNLKIMQEILSSL